MAMNCPYNDLDALPSMKQNRAPTERRAGYLTYLWYRCLIIDYRHVSTMWGPPVISWLINPVNYSYKML